MISNVMSKLNIWSSVKVNLNNNLDIALVKNNALVGAKVAVALAQLRENCQRWAYTSSAWAGICMTLILIFVAANFT